MRLRLKGALRIPSVENLSTGIEASATGESLNSGDPAVHPAARHNIDISCYGFCWTNFGGEIWTSTWPLLQHGRVERVQAVAAAKGGWSVCDPVLRLAGAAYGGS